MARFTTIVHHLPFFIHHYFSGIYRRSTIEFPQEFARSGLELIFGLGLLRKSWAQGPPLRAAALQRLQQLSVPWAVVESNPGRVRVTPGGRSWEGVVGNHGKPFIMGHIMGTIVDFQVEGSFDTLLYDII